MSKKVVVNVTILVLLLTGVVAGIFAIQQVTNYMSRAQEGVGSPQNVIPRVLGSDQAVISWSTTEEVLSLVLYGDSPASLVNTQTELSSVKTHRVTINNLEPDTDYFFKIQVGQEIFDNNGNPWQFKTPAIETPPKLTEQEFRKAYGTNDLRFDLNEDGVVNGFDFQLYLKEK